MCAAQTAPMDIGGSTGPHAMRQDNSSCAFPSWPRRSSLSASAATSESRATSYLSDEDLFPADPLEDDARSVSSAGSTASPAAMTPPVLTEDEMLEMQRERQAYQRELVRFLMSEKERRRQQQQQRRRSGSGNGNGNGSGGSRRNSSPKSKLGNMTPIAEAGGE